jgi:hypothetical protein
MRITSIKQINALNRKLWSRSGKDGEDGKTRDAIMRSFRARFVGATFALRTNFFGHCYTRPTTRNSKGDTQ